MAARRRLFRPRLHQFHVEAERPHLLDEDVEELRDARLESVVAAHDGLIDLGAAGNVIGFDGQHLLQRVGGAVSLERPHLHLAEALAAELRLAAEWLLGDEAVWSDRARVDLVVHQVVQLQHIDVAHRHLPLELLARASVIQGHLARAVEIGKLQRAR